MQTTTKKLLTFSIITLTALSLAGCGNSNAPKVAPGDSQSRIIDNPEFTMTIPKEWDVIESKDFTSDVPPETALVVRNNVKNEDFTANVNIIRRNLQNTQVTLDYAKEVINRQKSGLINYKESKRDSDKLTIGTTQTDDYLVSFEGKKDASSDLIEFYQTYAVKGNFAYIITGSYSPKETGDNINAVQAIVKSFAVK